MSTLVRIQPLPLEGKARLRRAFSLVRAALRTGRSEWSRSKRADVRLAFPAAPALRTEGIEVAHASSQITDADAAAADVGRTSESCRRILVARDVGEAQAPRRTQTCRTHIDASSMRRADASGWDHSTRRACPNP